MSFHAPTMDVGCFCIMIYLFNILFRRSVDDLTQFEREDVRRRIIPDSFKFISFAQNKINLQPRTEFGCLFLLQSQFSSEWMTIERIDLQDVRIYKQTTTIKFLHL